MAIGGYILARTGYYSMVALMIPAVSRCWWAGT